MEYPHSPEEAIDPRWSSYLHADDGSGPASLHTPDPSEHLGDAMREIIEPWQAGRRSSRETLEALRVLAERVL
jgi:hypothetical protein